MNTNDFHNWSPIRIYENNGKIFVDWCFLGGERFTAPFHDDTIENLLRKPFNLLFRRQTPIEFLGEIYEREKGIKPNGFIFHVSRCGSTLVSQMFAASRRNIVISEASLIDKIVRAETFFGDVSIEQKAVWLRWILNALGRKRFAAEENFFVKFDSWTVLDLPVIENAFPNVPWIFMYRNPVEVIVSNLRQPGMQMIPGAISEIFPQMDLTRILQLSTEERFARTIGAFCQSALKNADNPNAKFINYRQLPEVFADEICGHFAVSFPIEEAEKMRQASEFNAKTPQMKFKSDSAAKRHEASEEVIKYAEKFVDPLYEKLEKRRLQNSK